MSDGFQYKRTELIKTNSGPVRGFVDDGMRKFLGIPYAAPPVRDLRWRPPLPPSPWKGPLETVAFGGICAQDPGSFPGFGHTSTNEDCLYLNVFTPSHLTNNSTRLPVMVWIHGGGFVCGASNDYDPSSLVKDGNVVFVSLNYRLNIFGFFSHPAINAEGHPSGNYGIMDQQFALAWVQQNIGSFGGDAENVTIFGESAGGACVMSHLVSSGSHGLFHKIINESGGSPPTLRFPKIEDQEQQGINIAAASGCPEEDQTVENLRLISPQALRRADALPEGAFGVGKFPCGLMEDGTVIPKSLRQVFLSGQFSRVPVLMGVNRDEFSWFQAMMEWTSGKVITREVYAEELASTFDLLNRLHLNGVFVPPEAIAHVLELYPDEKYPSPSRALAAAVGDGGVISTAGRRTARVLKQHVPDIYVYEFDVPDCPSPWPEVSFPYGSAHTLELQFIFPLFHGGSGKAEQLTEPQQQLAKKMVGYWTTFAWHGTPNIDSDAVPRNTKWEIYDPQRDNVLLLETSSSIMISDWGSRHNSDFWDSYYK